jgi:hypothetical protein
MAAVQRNTVKGKARQGKTRQSDLESLWEGKET